MTVVHDEFRAVDIDMAAPQVPGRMHPDYPARRAARPIRVAPRAVTRRRNSLGAG